MDKIARLSARDRRDVFSEAATSLGIRPAIIEKDFWVCFVLKTLFVESPFKDRLVFKGGTSLSKVYRLIERFSEDLDLVLDWELIHAGRPIDDPELSRMSQTQRDKFNKNTNRLAGEFIRATLGPKLDDTLRQTGVGLRALVDPDDAQVVNIIYPAAFSEAYIRPEVRLEIGPLASWVPSALHIITPYAFDVLPKLFDNPSCPVLAIAAERTFWEKATILHQEAHRNGPIPNRYSRHYYDLSKLARSSISASALGQTGLLKDVVRFKQQFYRCKWARYDLAMPGSFRLLPASGQHLQALERDYADMQVMIFGAPLSFDFIVETLQMLQGRINGLSPN